MFLFDMSALQMSRPPKEEPLPGGPYDNVRLSQIGKITKNEQPVLTAGMGFGSLFSFQTAGYAVAGLWASFMIKKAFVPPGMSGNVVLPYAEKFKAEMDALLDDVLFNNGKYSKSIDNAIFNSKDYADKFAKARSEAAQKVMQELPNGSIEERSKRYNELIDDFKKRVKNDFRTQVEAALVLPDYELVDLSGELLGPDALGEKFVAETKKAQSKKVGILFGDEPAIRAAIRKTRKVADGFLGDRMDAAVKKTLKGMGMDEIDLTPDARAHMLEKTKAFEGRALNEMYWETAKSQMGNDFEAFYGVKVMPQQYTDVLDNALLRAGFWDHVNEGNRPANIKPNQIQKIKNGEDWREVLDAGEKNRIADSARKFMQKSVLRIKKLNPKFAEEAGSMSMPELIIREAIRETGGKGFEKDFWEKQYKNNLISETQHNALIKGGDYKGILSFEQMANIANREASRWERVKPKYSFGGKFDRALLFVLGVYLAWNYGPAIIGGILSPRKKTPVNKTFLAIDQTFTGVFTNWARINGNEHYKNTDFAKEALEWSRKNGKADAQGDERFDALKEFFTYKAFGRWKELDANKGGDERAFTEAFKTWANKKGLNWDFNGTKYMENVVWFVNDQIQTQKK